MDSKGISFWPDTVHRLNTLHFQYQPIPAEGTGWLQRGEEQTRKPSTPCQVQARTPENRNIAKEGKYAWQEEGSSPEQVTQ